jgi:hypothetical protein
LYFSGRLITKLHHYRAEGWVAISGDKRLEKNIQNKKAVIDAKCKVFILSDSNSRAEEWAAAVIVGKEKIFDLVRKNEGPFFANIGRQSRSHVANLRFPNLSTNESSRPTSEARIEQATA